MSRFQAPGGIMSLPVLPLLDGSVLLPGGFIRISSGSSQSCAAFVQHVLQRHTLSTSQKKDQSSFAKLDVDVVAVPLSPLALSSLDEDTMLEDISQDSVAGDETIDLDRLHAIGTAARVVELSRNSSSDDWTLVVEGRCRVKVKDITMSGSHQQPNMYIARVKQLDYFRAGQHARDTPSDSTSNKDEATLQKHVIKGVQSLFDLISSNSYVSGGVRHWDVKNTTPRNAAASTVGHRTLAILKSYDPALTSDLIGSLMAQDSRQRIVLLSTLDVSKRLKLVLAMVKARLSAVSAMSQGNFTGRPISTKHDGKGNIGDDEKNDNDDDDDDDELLFSLPPKKATSTGNEQRTRHPSATNSARSSDYPRHLFLKIKSADPPPEVLNAAMREYRKLKQSSNLNDPGYGASITYLETLADLPWNRSLPTNQKPPRLSAVREQLDADHHGLEKVKDRLVQFVAVQSLKGWGKTRAPVLCLVGPPGVGKTSVARSIATALFLNNRSNTNNNSASDDNDNTNCFFQRISLGGVRDEAEIRGHRRTYIGAMPGRIVNALKRAGIPNPVFLLDEIDKMGKDARGDPAAALLEVLDPEQNSAFVDTYLGVPVDLSKVVFIATANTVAEIPPPLLDRMEVVNLGGYTLDEKIGIAEKHLTPKTLSEHGLMGDQVKFPTDSIRLIVEGYTREAGVRKLAQCMASICRFVVVKLVSVREDENDVDESSLRHHHYHDNHDTDDQSSTEATTSTSTSNRMRETGLLGPGSMAVVPLFSTNGKSAKIVAPNDNGVPFILPVIVNESLIEQVLGPRVYNGHDAAQMVTKPGAAAGLVWTVTGGAVQYIECLMVGTKQGSEAHGGTLTLTGQLGSVLEESAKIAMSWVRAHRAVLELPPNTDGWDVHIHLPSGGVPKDGPSAGVTLAVALVSLFTGRCARSDTAMTGELTLRGLVLPVGGLREKILAAIAAGMKRVILPSRNLRDVNMELKEEDLSQIQLIAVERLDQVLAAAFDPPIEVTSKSQMNQVNFYPMSRL